MKKSLILLFLGIISFSASAQTISCKVVGISDGDTISCLTAEKQLHKVRLAEIDAPESKQVYGSASKKNLSDLIFNKNVKIESSQKDRYGRTVGYISYNGVDVNYEQIASGSAWFYEQYGHKSSYRDAQTIAKDAKKGMWEHSGNIPPWEFRRGVKKGVYAQNTQTKPATPVQKSSSSSFSCSSKRCYEIDTCAEAEFLLEHCGASRLDRDHDGIPCESICR